MRQLHQQRRRLGTRPGDPNLRARRRRFINGMGPNLAARASLERVAQLVSESSQRDQGAFLEGNRLGQIVKALLQPVEMARQKVAGLAEAGVDRLGEHCTELGLVHSEREAPRAGTAAQSNGPRQSGDAEFREFRARAPIHAAVPANRLTAARVSRERIERTGPRLSGPCDGWR